MNFKMQNFKTWTLLMFAVLAIGFTSCTKEDVSLVDIENFSDDSINSMQRGVVGKNHCLEFIFPVTIAFVDETTASVESYEDLHETITDWFEANDVEKTRENKPDLVFPIQVVNQEGEIVDVASAEMLKELKSECPRNGRGKGGERGKGFKCFSLVFPISATIAGETSTFADHDTFKAAIRAYKEEAGRDAERPELVYPVTVEYEDGTQVSVASQEEMIALKEDCKES